MSEDTKTIMFLLVFCFTFIILTYTRRNVRSFRLRKLVKRYNLNYKKNFKILSPFYPEEKAFNLITGDIGIHHVNFYDCVLYKSYGGVGRGVDSYYSFLEIDGVTKIQTSKSFIGVKDIETQLKNLS